MAKRTLVREVLYSQLAFAAAIGVIALASMWWVSNWVVRDNLDDWAVRWVGEMEEIAATFRAAGVTDGFHEGAAEIFRLLASTPFASETRESLDRSRSLEEAVRVFAEHVAKRAGG